jgi:two-component system response regulator CpxR
MMKRILLIDDDTSLCELVGELLSRDGYATHAAHEGESGLRAALSGEYSLVVLDVMLPGLNGFEVLRRLRADSALPVLMLTARGEEVDRIVGLEIGADDYLAKPFSPRELVARIRAILRREQLAQESAARQLRHSAGYDLEHAPPIPPERRRIQVGDVVLDPAARSVSREGEALELTAVEFDLLEVLLHNAGSAVTRDHLARRALGRPLSPFDRSMDTHMSNLRRKLGADPAGRERIKTLRSVGYLYLLPGD